MLFSFSFSFSCSFSSSFSCSFSSSFSCSFSSASVISSFSSSPSFSSFSSSSSLFSFLFSSFFIWLLFLSFITTIIALAIIIISNVNPMIVNIKKPFLHFLLFLPNLIFFLPKIPLSLNTLKVLLSSSSSSFFKINSKSSP